LYLYAAPIHSIAPLEALVNLKTLRVKTSALRTLAGIERLCQLQTLEFGGLVKLEDISSVRTLGDLRTLRIDTSRKIGHLGAVTPLSHLRILGINNCGKIQSLAPIRGLRELEDFTFLESTDIVDGDLSVLLELPRLREVAFQSRRHYRPSKTAVANYLKKRNSDGEVA